MWVLNQLASNGHIFPVKIAIIRLFIRVTTRIMLSCFNVDNNTLIFYSFMSMNEVRISLSEM